MVSRPCGLSQPSVIVPDTKPVRFEKTDGVLPASPQAKRSFPKSSQSRPSWKAGSSVKAQAAPKFG